MMSLLPDWDAAAWSTAFAAGAALFALITVLQTAATLRGARYPHLVPRGFTVGDEGPFLAVGNAGGGLAGPIYYLWIIDGRRYAEGVLGPMLGAGQQVSAMALEVPPGTKRHEGVVGCVDAHGNVHLSSLDSPRVSIQRRRPWRRPPARPDLRHHLAKLYPGIDLEGLQKVESQAVTLRKAFLAPYVE